MVFRRNHLDGRSFVSLWSRQQPPGADATRLRLPAPRGRPVQRARPRAVHQGRVLPDSVRAGVDPANNGTVGLSDAWFFRDTPPQTPSATVDQTTPVQTAALTLTVLPPTGGYYSTIRTIQWLKNGVVIPGASDTVLSPCYLPGDVIQAQ